MFIVVNSINQEHNHTHTFCLHTHTKAIEKWEKIRGRRREEFFVVMLYSLVMKLSQLQLIYTHYL
jgi:hypothetical protein